MTRADELTDRLIDGILTDAEAVELESLLAADPGARARHVAHLRLELSLRELRTEFDLAGATAARIEAERVERTAAAVMAGLAGRPAPGAAGRPWRRGRVWAAAAALAAAVLLAVWLGMHGPDGAPVPNGGGQADATPPDNGPPAAYGLARLAAVSGSVEVAGPGGAAPARTDQHLAIEQTLRTVDEESTAVVEFPDGTRLDVHPETTVRLVASDGAVRKVLLVEGRMTAVATGRPLVVGAGAAEVEASRGSFALWSSGPGSARVEPRDGDVRIVRGVASGSVVVAPGRAAFVRDGQTPVRIESPLAPQTTPRARLDFMALDAGFADSGEVVAVSAKQWARWKPGTPDPGRMQFLPRVGNDGLAAWLTPDRRAVALCRTDDREERVSVRALPSGEERGHASVRVTEPRFLGVAPDGSWVATASGQKGQNRRVRVWDVVSGTERFARELDDQITCLGASPDGRWLAVGVSDLGRGTHNAVVVLDTTTGARLFDLPTRRKAVMALAFTADGRSLAAGFNGAVQLWDVRERRLVRTLEGFERVVTGLAHSPDGRLIAAGTQDGQVWVWSAATGRRVQVIEAGTRGVRSVAFSPDGKLLVTATNKTGVAVWNVAPEPTDSESDA